MKQYAVLQPDEDGECFSVVEISDDPGAIKQLMEDYGIKKWRSDGSIFSTGISNIQYWDRGEAMLIEFEIKNPKPVKVVEEYKI